MFGQKILLTFYMSCLICLISLGITPVFALQPYEEEIAQGDGDPSETSVQEQLLAAQQLADAEKNSKEENIATITAEGDFLLPTYLLPVSKNTGQSDSKDTDDNKSMIEKENLTTKTTVTTKTTKELPIVVIKQTELIPVAEQMEVERQLTGSTEQTQKIYENAISRQKNRESISLQDTQQPNLTLPENTDSAPLNKKVKSIATDPEIDDILSDTNPAENNSKDILKKPLLLPLKQQKDVSPTKVSEATPNPIYKTFPSSFADKILSAAQSNKELPLIMPQDLKVSFYPNASDFSGQTIRWIKAFSLRVLQDPRYVIEIRLSTQNPALQQKRLYIIQRILAGTGLSQHQIMVDYVNRPVDSLILRTIKKSENISTVIPAKGYSKGRKTINW